MSVKRSINRNVHTISAFFVLIQTDFNVNLVVFSSSVPISYRIYFVCVCRIGVYATKYNLVFVSDTDLVYKFSFDPFMH